ncbi:MAG: NADH-quinone oxidoreductase subunit M [Candidatus Methanomethylicia archaeon]|nr:NADH-quinone oxidoreductase subunit M [Candidatus Methanomethylicia archaeon]MCX8168845.1 NADH-quinone oxidoreductase subunit M [Candidatus Methanomethylicia archaeon]MDW7988577.1 NADH-quinone oxidoreductase subunit M [Nitrososphaerota archaeon]
MLFEGIVLSLILTPLFSLPIVYIAGRRIGSKCGWVTFIPLLYTFIVSLILLPIITFKGPIYIVFPLAPTVGLNFGFLIDGLSLPVIFTITLLCTVVSIFSVPYMEHHIGEHKTQHAAYYALYLLYALGMIGTAISTNLIQFYFFWELMLLPSWALINIWGYGEREKIALKYFIYTHVGALALLAGILTLYSIFRTFELPSIISLSRFIYIGDIAKWIIIAMFFGFAVKMAIVPLHTWLPDAHAEAPTPISALLSPAMIGLGGYATVRIVYSIFPEIWDSFSLFLSTLALISMVYCGAMALAQDDIKRLLAYSSASQMGYILMGLASADPRGISGAMFHYFSHGTCKAILFIVAGALILETHGIRSISKLGGLSKKMPLTATMALIGFLGIAGTPPLNGFQSEWLIFTGAFYGAIVSHNTLRLIVVALGLMGSVLTAGYALWTMRRVFFGPLREELEDVHEPSIEVLAPMIILAFFTVLLGVYPRILMDLLTSFLS